MDNTQIKSYYNKRYQQDQLETFPCDVVRTEAFIRPILDRVAHRKRVLDIGCGVGYACELFLKHHYQVYGVDISDKAVSLARKRVPQGHFSQVDNGTVLPYQENFFDAVACLGVLEHVLHPESLLKECRRILTSSGIAVFVVPNSLSPYFRFFSGTGQIYEKPRTETEWENLLSRSGFQILERLKDPGPTIRKSFPLQKKTKILVHKCLNFLPIKYTYQFIMVTTPVDFLHS